MKQLLTVNKSGINEKYFIMNNNNSNIGQVKDTPYFNTIKEAYIYLFKMDKGQFINIYDMPQKEYDSLVSNR